MKKMILVAALLSVSNVFASNMDCRADVVEMKDLIDIPACVLKETPSGKDSVRLDCESSGIVVTVFKVESKEQNDVTLIVGKRQENLLYPVENVGSSISPLLAPGQVAKLVANSGTLRAYVTCTGK